ncbi:N,N-dimethylformamidase beta subunit family domain-containing protein [Bradyrhizobium elkanii]|uniref:N,N-dimethylformamidase beta subunit family domain-containing protein n=1 Tax=Bradyrhizobium elkanii TaxID=29448 RepID=UPI0030B94483
MIVTATHSGYYSREMYDAVNHFTHSGGRLIYLGGNDCYWRMAFNKPSRASLRCGAPKALAAAGSHLQASTTIPSPESMAAIGERIVTEYPGASADWKDSAPAFVKSDLIAHSSQNSIARCGCL